MFSESTAILSVPKHIESNAFFVFCFSLSLFCTFPKVFFTDCFTLLEARIASWAENHSFAKCLVVHNNQHLDTGKGI